VLGKGNVLSVVDKSGENPESCVSPDGDVGEGIDVHQARELDEGEAANSVGENVGPVMQKHD